MKALDGDGGGIMERRMRAMASGGDPPEMPECKVKRPWLSGDSSGSGKAEPRVNIIRPVASAKGFPVAALLSSGGDEGGKKKGKKKSKKAAAATKLTVGGEVQAQLSIHGSAVAALKALKASGAAPSDPASLAPDPTLAHAHPRVPAGHTTTANVHRRLV